MSKKILAFFVLACFLICLTACSSTTTSDTNNTTAKPTATVKPTATATTETSNDASLTNINTTVKAGDIEVLVKYSRTFLSSGYAKAKTGYQFVIIGVEIKNNSSQQVTSEGSGSMLLAPLIISMKDANNNTYSLVLGTGETKGELENLTNLDAGATASGELIYEVPDALTTLILDITDQNVKNGQTLSIPVKKAQ